MNRTNSRESKVWTTPIPTSEALSDIRLILRKISSAASVYPLLVKYPHRIREERFGQGRPRPKLHTRRPRAPDPRGLRARDAPRAPVERDGRLLGDADLGTSPLRGGGHPRRPLHSRHRG